MGIIKKIRKLSNTKLRANALAIAEAGYEALAIKNIFGSNVSLSHNTLKIKATSYDLGQYKKIYVVGVGKGSALAAQILEQILGSKNIAGGLVIDLVRKRLKKIRSMRGTHPLPSEQNIAATKKLIQVLEKATKDDLVLAIICGGGSSLLCQPSTVSCVDLQVISNHLLKSGADIHEINTVRKHLSNIHGGYLAKYAYPATLASLIISDVVGDDLDIIASGPTVLDSTTVDDAVRVAKKYHLPNQTFSETPKDNKLFANVKNMILANGSLAVEAMGHKAQELGYQTKTYSTHIHGPANQLGPKLAQEVKPGEALLGCGETTVVVKFPGRGGRNQDVALSALPYLKNSAIVSAASDGKDNIPVGGAITDSDFAKKIASKKHLEPTWAVEHNQSYKTLKRLRGIYQIRKVTANVSDFYVVLRDK